ncbi:MAG: hypothetical protein FWG65_03330 [Turicibacter sp.]|nr:hypothetical protein [Turicibacter sp.]
MQTVKRRKRKRPPRPRVVRHKISFYMIFTIMLIFAGGVGTAVIFAYNTDMRRQINLVNNQIIAQRDLNTALRAEIIPHFSLEEIAHIATTRLNMSSPDVSRVVRINVPRQSYVIQGDIPEPTRPETIWQALWQHITNLL